MSKCPCGARNTPDPSCDICDSWKSNPDTGWGGYTNHFKNKHYNTDEEELREYNSRDVYGGKEEYESNNDY